MTTTVFSLEFTHPLALVLLLALPVIVWWRWRQKQLAVPFSAGSLVQGLPAGRSTRAQAMGLILRLVALALLIIALAGPRWPDEGTRIPTEGMSIALVVDVSPSMTDIDFPWNDKLITRLDAVKEVFKLFVRGGTAPGGQNFTGRGNDLLSLVVFADYPETVCPLTLDHIALVKILEGQKARMQEWTNIGDGIAWALQGLVKSGQGKKALVLLTDGEQTKPEAKFLPRQAAQLAGNLGVPIYAIDAGKEVSAADGAKPEDLQDRARAKKTLQDLAEITGGQYFHAGDGEGLAEICRQIDERERTPIQSYQYRRYYEAFVWFGTATFLFLTMILGLELTAWRRVP